MFSMELKLFIAIEFMSSISLRYRIELRHIIDLHLLCNIVIIAQCPSLLEYGSVHDCNQEPHLACIRAKMSAIWWIKLNLCHVYMSLCHCKIPLQSENIWHIRWKKYIFDILLHHEMAKESNDSSWSISLWGNWCINIFSAANCSGIHRIISGIIWIFVICDRQMKVSHCSALQISSLFFSLPLKVAHSWRGVS